MCIYIYIIYLFRMSFIAFENIAFPRTNIFLLSRYHFSFGNMNVSKKVNYLLRKYDLSIQEYAKATPKWDELTLFECFGG